MENVFDIRFNVFSDNPEFNGHSRKLELHFEGVGLQYEHKPELGNPPELRELYGQNRRIWRRVFFSRQGFSALDRGSYQYVVSQNSICLMCAEKNPKTCHRTEIAYWIAEESNPEIKVIHL
ncbi:MAG: DUF488 family protein [Candidatus Hodarchaeota archaeon]